MSFFDTSHRPERMRHKNYPYASGGTPPVSDVKLHRSWHRSPSWVVPINIPIPGVRRRALRLWYISPFGLHRSSVLRFGRIRGKIVLLLAAALFAFTTFVLVRRTAPKSNPVTVIQWPQEIQIQWPTWEQNTLVYRQEDLRRIWKWEVESGHHPSRRDIPSQFAFSRRIDNPALPLGGSRIPSSVDITSTTKDTTINPFGAKRIYPDIQSKPPNVAYPPRPAAGSIADLDLIMEHCDFSQKKYVRDCLESLKIGAALDSGTRIKRAGLEEMKYIYVEEVDNSTQPSSQDTLPDTRRLSLEQDLSELNNPKLEPPLTLPPPVPYQSSSISNGSQCDPHSEKIFHMFWTGPFTDKPYAALLSFLFTQNLGLHLPPNETVDVCRPQFWMWVDLDPSAIIPRPTALRDMYQLLKDNPWSAPFLHPRFKDFIHFKLWNTTEQLDGVPELRDEWRKIPTLFNTLGHKPKVPVKHNAEEQGSTETLPLEFNKPIDQKDPTTTDSLSTIMSDLARFVLCHSHGGIYLDADTLFLRDWEDLWGWKGAFAYRWSYHEKYNTAVLRLHKGSPLGTFLIRTAVKNDFDFHPMTITRYVKDAKLQDLLFRLPDALFDPSFLTYEGHQLDRPPVPTFRAFKYFFETPAMESATAELLGFDGFFRGAYSFHYHNSWQKKLFDPSRNWPDLGSMFQRTEEKARYEGLTPSDSNMTEILDRDKLDLDWSTIVKRTFESYIRGERPNMYGEWLQW